MRTTTHRWTLLAGLVIGAMFAVSLYRGATQLITLDESFSYIRCLKAPATLQDILFERFRSENHVLQNALAFVSIKMFGVSELNLRLPSILGGLLYLVGLYKLTTLMFDRWLTRALAFGLTALNPLIIDYMSLARGYGLALALFVWSMYASLRCLRGQGGRPMLLLAGISLGLCTAANLTFAIPAASLAILFLIFEVRAGRGHDLIRWYCLPGLASAFLFLSGLVTKPWPENEFYFGNATLTQTVFDAARRSFAMTDRGFDLARHVPGYWWLLVDSAPWIAVALLVAIGAAWMASPSKTGLRLSAGTLLLSIAMLIVAHRAAGLLYPSGRTGIYFLFLIPLAVVCVVDRLSSPMRWVAAGACALVLVLYCVQFPTGRYMEWRTTSDLKQYFPVMRDASEKLHRPVRIGGTSTYYFPLSFYRDVYKWTWMEPFESGGIKPGSDFYIFGCCTDAQYVERLGLRKIRDTGDSVLAAAP